MPVGYMLLDNNMAVATAIQEDFKRVADAAMARPESGLLATHLGEPQAYGGVYPCWQFYKIVARGRSGLSDAAENMLAAEYACTLLTVYPAGSAPAGDTRTGTAYADEITMQAMSIFMEELGKDLDVSSRCTNLEMQSLSSGSMNEHGQVMFWDADETTLWAQVLQMGVYL